MPRLTDKTQIDSIASDDIMHIVDKSDTSTNSPNGTSKYLEFSQLEDIFNEKIGDYDYVIKASGTKYSSVGAACAANPGVTLSLFVDGRSGSVNETANISCSAGVRVKYISVWNRNGYKFDFDDGNDVSLSIESFGKGSTFLGSTSEDGEEGGIMINKGTNVSLRIDNCIIENISTKDDDGFINPNGDVYINNCEMFLGNHEHLGLDNSECDISSRSEINNLSIKCTVSSISEINNVGNGSNCSWCYVAGVNDKINNLVFDASTGAGLATSTTNTVINNKKALFYAEAGTNCDVTNLQIISAAGLAVGSQYGIVISSKLSNAGINPGASMTVYGMSNETLVEKVNFGISSDPNYTGGQYIQYENGNRITIRDCYNLTDTIDFGSSSSSWLFDRVKFSAGSSPDFQVNYTTVTNCTFDSNSTVSAYGCILKSNTGSSAIVYDEDSKNIIEDFRVIDANLVKDTMFASNHEVVVITDPETYAPALPYSIDANVVYSGQVYKGIQNNNTGNQPDTSPLFWEPTDTPTTQEFTAKYGKMYIIPGVNYAVNIICPEASSRKGDGFSVFPENLLQSLTLEAGSGDTINGASTANIGNPTTTCKVTSLGGTKMISSGTTAPP